MPGNNRQDSGEDKSDWWYHRKDESEDEVSYYVDTSKLDRRQFITLTSAITGSTLLAGCSGTDQGGTTTEGGGGGPTEDVMDEMGGEGRDITLVLGFASEMWGFDPAISTVTHGHDLVYDNLYTLNPGLELIPWLDQAEKEPMNNAKTFEYTLPKDVTFTNGDEVTSSDVKYSVEWILNSENNSPLLGRYWTQFDRFEVVDDKTFRMHHKRPFSTWNLWIPSALYVVREGARGEVKEDKGHPQGIITDISRDPTGAGCGPYNFEEWKSGSHATFSARDDYWMDGLPVADTIRMEFIQEDATRVSDLRAGNIDYLHKLPPNLVQQLNSQPNITAKGVTGNNVHLNFVNMTRSEDLPEGVTNPMGEKHNRLAWNYAIDRRDIIDSIHHGHLTHGVGVYNPEYQQTSPRLRKLAKQDIRDLDKAREHLEKAGNPDGFDVKIFGWNADYNRDTCVRLQEQVSEVGINAEVSIMDKGTLYDNIYGGNEWHIAVEDWTTPVPSSLFFMQANYGDVNRSKAHWQHQTEELNEDRYPAGPPAPTSDQLNYLDENPREKYGDAVGSSHAWFVDKLADAKAETNEEKRNRILWELDEFIYDNAIQITFGLGQEIAAWRNSLVNMEENFGAMRRFFERVEKKSDT